MIFIYPAAISDNVDIRYLPGLIKTMELYYLHHIAESVANGDIRFYITQNRFTGSYSHIKMEAINWDYESLGCPDTLIERADMLLEEAYEMEKNFISEASPVVDVIHRRINDLNKEYKSWNIRINAANRRLSSEERELRRLINPPGGIKISEEKIRAQQSLVDDLRQKIRDYEKRLESVRTEIGKSQSELDKQASMDAKDADHKDQENLSKQRFEYEKEKERARIAGGVTRMELDKNTLDLRPSAITVEASVAYYEKRLLSITPKVEEKSRAIPISVKIVPIRMKNVSDIYNTLSKDLYTNAFSSFYKSVTRSLTSKFYSLLTPIFRRFLSDFTKPEEFSVWKDMLYKGKSLVNASAMGSGPRFPSHQKYAASIVVLSVNDISKKDMNFLTDPSKVAKLHKMGWNSFAIMDDPDQMLMFCSYFENGMCSKIPYSYLFASLKASDLFKELDSLSKFTGRIIGNFRSRPIQVVESLRFSSKLKTKNNESFNKYLGIANKHGSK